MGNPNLGKTCFGKQGYHLLVNRSVEAAQVLEYVTRGRSGTRRCRLDVRHPGVYYSS